MPKAPKLVLHFDVNETIMVSDPAAGNTLEETLNIIVSKSAMIHNTGSVWHHGLSVGTPHTEMPTPPLHTAWEREPEFVPYIWYNRNGAKTFTNPGEPGEIYREHYSRMEQALRVNGAIDERLSHDGKYYFLIPAFFRTISELARHGRNFAVVIRTFGTDVDDVVAALQAYSEGALHLALEGQHQSLQEGDQDASVPQLELNHPPVAAVAIKTVWSGRYDKASKEFILECESNTDSAHPGAVTPNSKITDEQQVVNLLQGSSGCISATACQDDYYYWRDNNYAPQSGKPLWITRGDSHFHHIFFDDNIHNNPNDSIVAVRARNLEGEAFMAESGEATLGLQGVHLVRVPTILPILDHDWFLKQITKCEAAKAKGEGGCSL